LRGDIIDRNGVAAAVGAKNICIVDIFATVFTISIHDDIIPF